MAAKLFIRLFPSSVWKNLKSITNITRSLSNDYVRVDEVGDKGILMLNRGNAMNATNLDMLETLSTNIKNWSNQKSLIIVKGVAGKAFSAGGDLRSLVESSSDVRRKIFRTEYEMNHVIANLETPYIAFIDGVTMGGGVGISIYADYCIATENTLFGMPESSVGLFPDCGSSYFFPRLNEKIGYYLGLTGFRLRGPDVLHAGIATHYCDSAKIPEMEKALLSLKDAKNIGSVIDDYCQTPQTEFILTKHLDQINKCFDASSVEEILDNLEKDNSEWAKQTINMLRKLCPTSLKIIFRNLELGKNLSLGECLQMEYRLALRLIAGKNFQEGVRALLITKDNNPNWDPSRIEDVTDEYLSSFYKPLPNNEELPIDVKLNEDFHNLTPNK
ncbi:3-hydroxyisobutyryl-CoA hydrolase, mitochondrial-like [Contarinia nasturtii]|uniref:3-hydroxyisobutyryl-CoA hydrolase, mitochondrial-like n=1 Tax=Contarinia nasturtii TaxID=265458 RepID=UPI0012D453F6|nr:3-hydroxyisobutyryl-CoA hydrolase, mitochondrial-like [Contarinia nasturtii]